MKYNANGGHRRSKTWAITSKSDLMACIRSAAYENKARSELGHELVDKWKTMFPHAAFDNELINELRKLKEKQK